MVEPSVRPRVSHERLELETLRSAIGDLPHVDSRPLVTTSDIREQVARVPLVVLVPVEAITHRFDSRAFVRGEVPEAIVPDDGDRIEVRQTTQSGFAP